MTTDSSTDSSANSSGSGGATSVDSNPSSAGVITNGTGSEGSLTSLTSLYKGPKDEDKKFTWLDKEPENTPNASENSATAQHALITRLQKSEDARKKYEIHSIIVQSPWLKKALGEILEGYPGIHCGMKRLIFEAPFQPFVHRWADIVRYMKRKDIDEKTSEHLGLLFDVLEAELNDTLKTLKDYVQHGVVSWDHLWTIFQPGQVIYSHSHLGAPAALLLREAEVVETKCGMAYKLTADTIDWHDPFFGRRTEKIAIFEYLGLSNITALNAFPLIFHPGREEVVETLVKRGEKFESLAGCHYKEHDGYAVTWDREGNEVPIHVSGRIIIDCDSFRRFASHHVSNIKPLGGKEGLVEPECAPTPARIASNGQNEKYEFGKKQKRRLRLTKELQLICRPRVRGYSLKKKKWLEFFVDCAEDIRFSDNAFDSLALPEDQKQLILAFAESQAMHRGAFDDVILGKGKGHITLLSGPPGVGKTLTAESVAEHMHAPLYMMSAGDLGTRSYEVEYNLNNILDMVAKWSAVLLLDECDVFLEARSAHDLERNKLVSIFLRVLEYYEGILFLTTNRISNIDAAFQSRIHVSLSYPDLTPTSRRQIWENFLRLTDPERKGGLGEWGDEELQELAKVELNGRQIKNVLKSAALLAARKKEPLSRKYVDMVLAIEQRRPGVKQGFE
ncbi:ATPase [Sporormia fimetaria CBS 119925]|uniref:ATPase n=1 Tax=Sporormia fimetaria CBS 119925 TaxID=1340428 RepID=A0A6A6VRJ2_9PLEO|nr:ATPase [Sporormia fimetaria CBS 119925]